MTKKTHTVVIVDDHTIMRDGLKALLSAEEGLNVVAAVSDGSDAVQSAMVLKPDIVLMDIAMPNQAGVIAITEIKKSSPDTRIIVLTFYKEPRYIHAALQAGAAGYVLKEDSREELFSAITSVLSGKSYLSPSIAEHVVSGYLSGGVSEDKKPSWEVLTKREREVIKLIAEGNRTKEIAVYLSLSPKTVEKHRTNLMKKLDLHSVSAVTSYAILNGLVSQ